MSRHTLVAKDAALEVVVGWDRPLSSYFAQVYRSATEAEQDDEMLLWLGASGTVIETPEALIEPLAPYAELTAEHLELLRHDRAEAPEPTPFQRAVRLFR